MKRIKLRSLVLILPLTALLASSAVSIIAQIQRKPQSPEAQTNTPRKRTVVARGQLTGTRASQQIVTWKTGFGQGSTTHLAIETTGGNPRALWQAQEYFLATDINNVRVADLDGDRVPEIIALFWRGASAGATLRVFHWDPSSRTFVEIDHRNDEAGTVGIHSYRIRGRVGHQRIIVYTGTTASDRVHGGEFEVRGSELVRLGGGGRVTPQAESGIEGQSVISPVRPGPQRQDQSGSAPYRTTLAVVNTAGGREVARFETGSDGRFRVSLPPGEYRIGPPPETHRRGFPRGEEQTVKVLPGQFTRVTIEFDSGMR
ncbi:MAG: carboxypeptidase-like regulatory domain-containing protein [Blastocatellia bacterium]